MSSLVSLTAPNHASLRVLHLHLGHITAEEEQKLADDISSLTELEELRLFSSTTWRANWRLPVARVAVFECSCFDARLVAPRLISLSACVSTSGLMQVIVGCPLLEQLSEPRARYYYGHSALPVDLELARAAISSINAGHWGNFTEFVVGSDVSMPSAVLLAMAQNFTKLTKIDCHVQSASLVRAILTSASSLTSLELRGDDSADEMPAIEAKRAGTVRHDNLTSLKLRGVPDDLRGLQLPKLRKLSLVDCAATDLRELLSSTPELRELKLNEMKSLQQLFPADVQLPELRTLYLNEVPLRDADITSSSQLSSLERLYAFHCWSDVSAAGWTALQDVLDLGNLKSVNISFTASTSRVDNHDVFAAVKQLLVAANAKNRADVVVSVVRTTYDKLKQDSTLNFAFGLGRVRVTHRVTMQPY